MSNPEIQKGRLNAILTMNPLQMQIATLESVFVDSPWCVEGNMDGRFAMVAEGDVVTADKSAALFIFDRATNMRVDLAHDPVFSLTMLHLVGPSISPSNEPGKWNFTLRTGEVFTEELGKGLMAAILLNGIQKIPSKPAQSDRIEQQISQSEAAALLIGQPPANDKPC